MKETSFLDNTDDGTISQCNIDRLNKIFTDDFDCHKVLAAIINAMCYLNHIDGYSFYGEMDEHWIEEEESECGDIMATLIKDLNSFKNGETESFHYPSYLNKDEHACLMYFTALNLYEGNGKYVTKDNVDSILRFLYAIRILIGDFR